METINHECYVSLEVAKLLKEAGFDWECKFCFSELINATKEAGIFDATTNKVYGVFDSTIPGNGIATKDDILRPTIDVAQRWLREKNLLLYIPPCHIDGKWLWRYWIINCINKEDTTQIYSVKKYDTYEEALEAGIKKALEMMLEKGE